MLTSREYIFIIFIKEVRRMTGILIIDKPEGMTSFDVVAKARRICGEKKCGHSGTLDPMATGVMTLLFGGATGFLNYLPSHDKEYIAQLKLGTITDTLDITGKVLEEREFNVTAEEFAAAAKRFKGEITQLPPMYSAISVGGERLYDLARKGIEVDRPERQVNIYRIDILENDEANGIYKIDVACSGGTYIRSLVADIGEALGCGAVLSSLRRVKANGFTISESVTLEGLEKAKTEGKIAELLIPIDKALSEYPEITVSPAQAVRFSNGGPLSLERLHNCKAKGLYRVYDGENNFLGLGENDGESELGIAKVFINR
jgi:tRNA pseudouridine55 synthase